MSPQISIIVPVYNTALFLRDTLKSIQNQTLKDIEIICVNDGSTDESGKILDDFAKKDERIRVLHKENEGVSVARLEGVKAARGEYIGFVDSDDYVEENMYEVLLYNIKKHEADISHCGYQAHQINGEIQFLNNEDIHERQDSHRSIKQLLRGEIEPGLCNKLYKRCLFQKVLNEEQVDTSIKIYEDLLMNYQLFRLAKLIVYEDVCYYHYIKREDSASTAKLNIHKIEDPIKVKQMIVRDCEGTLEEQESYRALMSTYQHVYNSILLSSDSNWEEWKRKVRKEITQRRNKITLLPFKQRVLCWLIIIMPHIYSFIYNLYLKRKKR